MLANALSEEFTLQNLKSVAISAAMIAFLAASVFAQDGMQVIREVKHDTSAPLRSLPAAMLAPAFAAPHTMLPVLRPGVQVAATARPDAALQTTHLPFVSATLGLNFEGLGQGQYGFTITGAPADPNGAVGATQYVQWVNTSFAVFDKATGALLMGPVAGNALWSGFGGGCQNNNDGDPIVSYDQLANRWVMTQFSVSTTPFLQCVAVSTTNDATGSYNRYAFQLPNFNDYPKFGVWPDAYYFSFNMFNSSGTTFFGADACAANRTAMLAGNTATMICFQQGASIDSLLPSDMDGSIVPAAGEPNFYMDFTTNALRMWKFHVDFATPANSTFTGPTNLAVASFTPLCNGGVCVPQPSTTNPLDSLGDRLMYRLAWRKFPDGHEALVVTHSISTGIRWYEIRNPNGTPTVFQQGTFAPTTATRWMGSITMDQAGDMALGYSESSSTVHPSVFVTGRVPGDPAGSMETEMNVVTGGGSQTGGLTRWGDYSAMSIDPTDDCTFWYTQQYIKTNGSFNWNTRIASFKFPTCGSAPPPVTLNPSSLSFGSVTVGTTSAPQAIQLTNNQSTNLTISSISTAAPFAVSSQTCGTLPGAVVAAGASCTINVTFSPTTSGTQNGTLSVSDNAPGGTQTASLSGTGASAGSPVVKLSVTSLNFGTKLLNTTTAAKTVTLTNTGTATLNISNIGVTGDYAKSAATCGATVAVNASCTVSVTFTPTAINTRTGTLSFTDNAANTPQNVTLTGVGTEVSFTPASLSFARTVVGQTSATKTVTITNKGTTTMTFTGFALTGTNPGDFAIVSNTCGSTLAAAGTCVVGVQFKPTAINIRRANLSVSDNGGGSPQLLAMSGTGTILAISPLSWAYGIHTVGTSTAKTFTLTNAGTVVINFTGFSITGTNPGDFPITANTCASSLAVGASCSVTVTFKPTATGSRKANLSIADNAGGSPQLVSLVGTGQ
jgi:hypothetical protein